VDASASDLQELNPSLLRLTTPKDAEFELHVPAGTAAKFQTAVASIPVDKRVWWRYHKVQPGETLASIARTYHSEPKSIAQANDLGDGELAPESRLIIPIAPGKQSDSATYSRAITRYKIRKGDTIESVAENFGVSPKMLRSWNRIKGEGLAGRKILLVHLPVTPGAREPKEARVSSKRTSKSSTHASSAKTTPAKSETSHHAAASESASAAVVHHKVRQGETLSSIASSYNTTVSALKQSNRNIATLRPGMVLIIHDAR
jgi:membrane-bound lytic murein transglycosylase D